MRQKMDAIVLEINYSTGTVCSSCCLINTRMVWSMNIRWVGHIACMNMNQNTQGFGQKISIRPLGRPTHI